MDGKDDQWVTMTSVASVAGFAEKQRSPNPKPKPNPNQWVTMASVAGFAERQRSAMCDDGNTTGGDTGACSAMRLPYYPFLEEIGMLGVILWEFRVKRLRAC